MKKHIANALTVFRILGSMILLFLPAFSLKFYIVYLLCGFSDMIDGTIARKTNSVSTFSGKLDTAADLVFVIAASMKLLPALRLPLFLWIWIGAIALIKICNILCGYICEKQFVSLHTSMNKLTGLLLFLLPLTGFFIEFTYGCMAVCAIATLSALQEGMYISAGCASK